MSPLETKQEQAAHSLGRKLGCPGTARSPRFVGVGEDEHGEPTLCAYVPKGWRNPVPETWEGFRVIVVRCGPVRPASPSKRLSR